MAAPQDRVRVLKNESSGEGGTEDDFGFPALADPNSDAPSVAGIFYQPPSPSTSSDELVYTTRDSSGNLIFKDSVTGQEYTLTQLIGGEAPTVWRKHFLIMGG